MGDSAVTGLFATFGLALVLFFVVFWVLMVVADWKIFTKAGEAGWKSIIPVYSNYILFKISWEAKWFWIDLLLFVVSSVCTNVGGGAMQAIGGILMLGSVVVGVLQTHKLSKSFGHGGGFTVGLIFLPNIFTLILGFGSSEYQGPQ